MSTNLINNFISMNTENLEKHSINPVNDDYIFLFDIDDTLYKRSEKMKMVEKQKFKEAYNHFKLQKPDVPEWEKFLDEKILYAESFRIHFNKTCLEVEKIRACDYKKFITEDKELKNYLKNFQYRSWCFTNGLRCRAEPILEGLNLSDVFEGVICMDDNFSSGSVRGKPQEEMYKFVEDLLKIKNKNKVFFFDDSLDNIETGRKMGWNCYLIDKEDNLLDKLKIIVSEIQSDMER
ncbi:putative haloacid dehalogenase-like hydrolase [Vairimorpha necatrix]|uniref:Haloacid dehalogenase-like hydrolase n=1 Tax=Vairimorpha necatrix TaxID=6039 RepID=A0AAX4JFU1_9MICR